MDRSVQIVKGLEGVPSLSLLSSTQVPEVFHSDLGHTSLKSSNTILPAEYRSSRRGVRGSVRSYYIVCLLETPLIVISKKHHILAAAWFYLSDRIGVACV